MGSYLINCKTLRIQIAAEMLEISQDVETEDPGLNSEFIMY